MALSFYGAESCLPATSDTQPPQNANEIDWHTSRFATPSTVPSSSGFTDMTFVLVHRIIADSTRILARVDPLDFERKEAILRQTEADIHNYLRDTSNPSYKVVAAFAEVRIASLRLPNRYREAQKATSQPIDPGRHQCVPLCHSLISPLTSSRVFIAALELLEAFEYHSKTFASSNWEWIFLTIVPWLALAIVLTSLPNVSKQSEIDRAQWQINLNFQRFSDPENPISGTPMWKLLVQLKEYIQAPPPSQGDGMPRESPTVPAMAFAGDLMLDSQLYPVGAETFLYEDQFMEDLPW